jgi:hypothetical protein
MLFAESLRRVHGFEFSADAVPTPSFLQQRYDEPCFPFPLHLGDGGPGDYEQADDLN